MGAGRMIDVAIAALVERRDLLPEEAHAAMMQVMGGEATPAQIAGFLVALRMKGETVDEITGCARAMRAHVTPARPQHETLVDTAGTGGDGAHTFNISTSAALVAAAAGAHRRQARQPGGVVAQRVGRRAGGAGRADRPAPRPTWPTASTRSDSASCSRQAHHPAMRHAGPVSARAGRAHACSTCWGR